MTVFVNFRSQYLRFYEYDALMKPNLSARFHQNCESTGTARWRQWVLPYGQPPEHFFQRFRLIFP